MGDLLDSIFGSVGDAVVGALESFVIWLFNFIVAVFQVLYQVIQAVAAFFVSVAKAVAGFFDRLWTGFFKGIFQSVWNAIKSGWQWLETKLGALIRFLQRLRTLLNTYYVTYIRPILQMIQHVRQYLQILSALHIGFAQKLDAWLAQVQAKISQSFATIIGTINTLTDIANALMDPSYLIRKPALLLSIRRQIPALIRVVTGRPAWWYFPSPKGSKGGVYGAPAGPLNFADSNQNPPASALLGTDDGIGDPTVYATDFTLSVEVVDTADVLDYFNDDLYPDPPCTDPVKCLNTARQLLLPSKNV